MLRKMYMPISLAILILVCVLTSCDDGSSKTSSYFDTQSTDGRGKEEWPPIVLSAENVHFEFVCSGSYDNSEYVEIYRLKKGTYYTGFRVLDALSKYISLQEDSSLQMDEVINLEEYSYIISFGREIADIEFDKTAIFNGENDYNPIVTFAEEQQGDIAFLYRLNKLRLLSLTTESYFLKGNEKVSAGIQGQSLLDTIDNGEIG